MVIKKKKKMDFDDNNTFCVSVRTLNYKLLRGTTINIIIIITTLVRNSVFDGKY